MYQYEKSRNQKKYLSAYWFGGRRKYINDEKMTVALKFATTVLNYPSLQDIPIDRVDNHSLRYGGSKTISLLVYRDRDIQIMGIWRGKTFKEYIEEELHYFTEGM